MNLSEKLYAEFEQELVKSEFQRAAMMAGVFFLAVVIMSANFFLIDEGVIKFYGGKSIYFFTISWVLVFILYEIGVIAYIQRSRKAGLKISLRFKILQTTVEITYISLLFLYVIDIKNIYSFIDSPVQFVYFFFIILSILHLDYRISLLSGFLSALQFGSIIFYAYHFAGIPVRYMPSLPEDGYYVRCVIFILSAGVAAFVAQEVKRRVRSSLNFKLQKSEIEVHLGQQVSRDILTTLTEEGGKTKKVEATVLALDIRGFTRFAEGKSLDEIQDFQNKFFSPILDIINQHRGIVNQILGDGIMATFGAPSPNPLHADMAFQAALKILDKVQHLVEAGEIPETKIGMGIHSGEVITGNIGNEQRKQYSISGKAVIIAFRLEQLNKEYQSELLISEEVKKRIVLGHAVTTRLGLLSLKGLEQPVEVYRVG
ncbi:MAG TPA: adenylate/guanylate cyclase domain-containing protein [Cyclobacteriaceae bacterium]